MRRLLLAALVALPACGDRTEQAPPPAEAAVVAPAAAPGPERTRSGPAGFVGRWGRDPRRGAQEQYVFTRTALEAPGGLFCSFRRVAETPTGWDIEAACGTPAAGSPTAVAVDGIGDGLRLRIAGREPVTLRICAENWGAEPPAPPERPLEQAAAADARIAAGGAVRPYEFKHQGVIHEAWRENDQVLKIAEKSPGSATGEVVYYFAPGAQEPFLVRDGAAAYGFEQGRLLATYDATGRPVSGPLAAPGVPERLLARGRALRLAADG